MYRERRRDRPVKDEELPGLLQAIEAEPNPYVRGLFQLLLLTGLRKSEWLRAKRDDIDHGRGTLRLADTKSSRLRHVPPSSAALEVLRGLPPRIGNPYLFPSTDRAVRRYTLAVLLGRTLARWEYVSLLFVGSIVLALSLVVLVEGRYWCLLGGFIFPVALVWTVRTFFTKKDSVSVERALKRTAHL